MRERLEDGLTLWHGRKLFLIVSEFGGPKADVGKWMQVVLADRTEDVNQKLSDVFLAVSEESNEVVMRRQAPSCPCV